MRVRLTGEGGPPSPVCPHLPGALALTVPFVGSARNLN